MNFFSCLRRQKFIVYKFIFNTFCCSNVGCKFFQKIHLPREEKDLRHHKSFQQMSTSTQKLFHESTVSQKYIVVIKYSKLNWSNWSQSFCTMEIQWSGEIKRESLAYAFVKHCQLSCLKLLAQGRSYYFDTTKRITLLWKISRGKLAIPAQTKQVLLILQNCVFKLRSISDSWEKCSTSFSLAMWLRALTPKFSLMFTCGPVLGVSQFLKTFSTDYVSSDFCMWRRLNNRLG